jgi:hypothetical protein
VFNGFGLALILALLIAFAVHEKIRHLRFRERSSLVLENSQASPLSKAITSLYGLAGGIYLSLVLICTFLEVQLPDRILLGGFTLEPLATVSIALALIQPFILRLSVLRKV